MTPDGIQEHLRREISRIRNDMDNPVINQTERDGLEEMLYTLMAELDMEQKKRDGCI